MRQQKKYKEIEMYVLTRKSKQQIENKNTIKI